MNFKEIFPFVLFAQILLFPLSVTPDEVPNNRFKIPLHLILGSNSTALPKTEAKIVAGVKSANFSDTQPTNHRFPIPPSLTTLKEGSENNSSRNGKSIWTNLEQKLSPIFTPTASTAVLGNPGSFGSTPPSITLRKPAPSYFRPGAKPTGPIPPIPDPSIPGSVLIPGNGVETTFPPISLTTLKPFVPTSTYIPLFTTTTATTTTVPIIGTEVDEDDEEQDVPLTEEGGVGRSLLVNPRMKKPYGSRKPNYVQGTAKSLYDSDIKPGSRPMGYGGTGDQNVVKDFVFSDIKCYRTKSREFFGATIHMKKGYHVPYIRDRPQDPLTSSDCKMDRLDTPDARYRITASGLRACGVEQCGDSFCLTMVFPRVLNLALADDEVTTIKCLPQQSYIAETQSISFTGDKLENRRSSSTVEGGGQDFAAEVGIFRQNPGATNGLFAKRVSSGGVVQLGEPLQLRSVVRGGDGWAHSLLSDVKVWRMREGYNQDMERLSPNDASEVITLVDPNGCRNAEYDIIADSHPFRDPRNYLVHHFTFRAFLFRGQRTNEPLIVTAKVQACQEAGDCRNDCVGRTAEPQEMSQRYRRAIELHNSSSIIHDYDSQLALHVVGPRDDPSSINDKPNPNPVAKAAPKSSISIQKEIFSCEEKIAFSAVAGACLMLFLCGLVATLLFYSVSKKRAAALKKADLAQENRKSEHSYVNTQMPFETSSKQNKPLPPLPTEPDSGAVVGNEYTSDELLKTSYRRSYHSRSKWQETLDGHSQGKSPDDGVVIVYCCKKDKKKHGAVSAPSSVRGKKKHHRSSRNRIEAIMSTEPETTEESEFYSNEKPRPRTVRDVKRSHQKQQRSSGIRRRLSSIYREVYGNRHRGSSIPARISPKDINGSTRRAKIYYKDEDSTGIYSGDYSQTSGSYSPYCENLCFKHVDVSQCKRSCGTPQKSQIDLYCNVFKNEKQMFNKPKFPKPLPAVPSSGFQEDETPLIGNNNNSEISTPILPPKAFTPTDQTLAQILGLPEASV